MPLHASSGSLRRRRSPSVDDTPCSPTTTPNTRKRQRIDYAQLHNRGRSTTPTPAPTYTPTVSQHPDPIAQMLPQSRPRMQPRDPLRPRPLFVPTGRQPVLQPSTTTIEVARSLEKESGITKHKWWWAYFTVRVLNTMFHKGRNGDGDLVWNEHYTCKVSSSCTFERYANKLKSSTTALSDHIVKYHHLTEAHNPDTVLSGQPTSSSDIRAFLTDEKDNPTVEEALLDWITYTNKPFTVTECQWFTRMLRAAGYNSRIPKADAIRYKLEAQVDTVIAQIIRDIERTSTTVCLTLDSWTSKNKKSMLAINIRWLDENFNRH